MSLGFGAPIGLLGLLGIPVLIALYAIQDRHKREKVATLFLIEVISEDTSTARRIDYVRLPLSFWLQLLAIFLSTILLAKLYYTQFEQFERVLVLVDGSASMAAFKVRIPGALEQIEERLSGANRLEWTIVTSDIPHRILYQGTQRSEANETLTGFHPESSGHSLNRALEIARQSASHTQISAVITDHKDPALNSSIIIGIGENRGTVGFSGGNVHTEGRQLRGELLIKNYSQEQQTRRLFTTQGNKALLDEVITLAPNEIRRLSRRLNATDGDISLRLEPDDFPFDDFLPMVIPSIKTIKWQLKDGQELFSHIYRLMSRFPNIVEVSEHPGLEVSAVRQSALSETTSALAQIQWLVSDNNPEKSQILRANGAVAVNHPLVRSLRFAPLLVPLTTTTIPATDEVLVWLNNHPVISLGGTRDAPILRILFDLRYSNAMRLPAFIILIHRFLEDLRSRVVALEAKNIDTSQLISVPLGKADGKKSVTITTEKDSRTISIDSNTGSTIIRAPSKSGFFDIVVEGESVVHGATNFQDSREADLSKAESFEIAGEQQLKPQLTRNASVGGLIRSEVEGLTSIFIVLAALAIVLSWLYSAPLERTTKISSEGNQP
jgi:hypothetical protein